VEGFGAAQAIPASISIALKRNPSFRIASPHFPDFLNIRC
jgi:hypothetical protein